MSLASWYFYPYVTSHPWMWLNLVTCFQLTGSHKSERMQHLRLGYKNTVTSFLPFFPLWAFVLGKPAAIFWVALWRGPCVKGLIYLANSQGESEALPVTIWMSLEADCPTVKPWGDCSLGWHFDDSLVKDLRKRQPAKPQPDFWSTETVR